MYETKQTGVGATSYDPIYKYKQQIGLSGTASTFTAQIYGIYKAVKYAFTLKEDKILILADLQPTTLASQSSDKKTL